MAINGVFFSILAAILISLQAVFNTRVSEKIGLWTTNVIVHSSGLLLALIILLFTGEANLKNIHEVNKLYLLGGVIGVIIVYSVMKGVSTLGTTLAIAIILAVQLITAAIIDGFGLFGTTPKQFDYLKITGLMVMITGIIMFKWRDC